MSEIDQYKHKCIGIGSCPSTYEIVNGNNTHRNIPLYRLDENASEWDAKQGDLLLGGGSGESKALRVSIPEAILWLTQDDWDEFDSLDNICKAYWSMTNAYIFCDGYIKIGWQPQQPIEIWLVEHIVSFIVKEYPEIYSKYCGSLNLEKDGTIFRLPRQDSIETGL